MRHARTPDTRNSVITFSLVHRTNRTPAWAAKQWWVWRKQYCLATIKWDVKLKCYQLGGVITTASFDSGELFDISEFVREQTQLHRYELWERNCDRTSKQASRLLKRKR